MRNQSNVSEVSGVPRGWGTQRDKEGPPERRVRGQGGQGARGVTPGVVPSFGSFGSPHCSTRGRGEPGWLPRDVGRGGDTESWEGTEGREGHSGVPPEEGTTPQLPPLTCGIAGRRGPADVGQQVLDVGHGLSLLLIHGGLRGGAKTGIRGLPRAPPAPNWGSAPP